MVSSLSTQLLASAFLANSNVHHLLLNQPYTDSWYSMPVLLLITSNSFNHIYSIHFISPKIPAYTPHRVTANRNLLFIKFWSISNFPFPLHYGLSVTFGQHRQNGSFTRLYLNRYSLKHQWPDRNMGLLKLFGFVHPPCNILFVLGLPGTHLLVLLVYLILFFFLSGLPHAHFI